MKRHRRHTVIASEAKQSSFAGAKEAGLLRRFAPRNDGREALFRRGRLTRAGTSKLGTVFRSKALTLWAMAIGFVMRDGTQEGFSGLEMSLARMLAINLG